MQESPGDAASVGGPVGVAGVDDGFGDANGNKAWW